MQRPNLRAAGGSLPRPMHTGRGASQYGACGWGRRHAGKDGVPSEQQQAPDAAAAVAVGLQQRPVTIVRPSPPSPSPSPLDSPDAASSLVSFSLFITPPSSPPPFSDVDESDSSASIPELSIGSSCRPDEIVVVASAVRSGPFTFHSAMSAPSEDGGPERRPLLAAVTTGGEREWEGRASGDGVGDADTEERAVGGGVGTFTRNLGAVEAFAIVISIVIGSGVFTSPGSIDTNVPSPGAALLVWLVGGVLAWTGASTMAELGTAIPGEGGVQPYLKYIFGDVFGFLAAWTWVVAVMPATLAILSIVFIESIYSAAGVTGEGDRIVHKLLSIAVLACIGVANSISTKASTRLNNFFVATKFITIAAIVLAGVVVVVLQLVDPNRQVGGGDWREKPWFGYRDSVNPDGSVTHWDGLGQWDMFGHLSAALYAALWAYSGWDKAIYISAELSAPARQLPLAINTSLPSIILCFLAANAVYYILLPWNVVATTDSVAVTAITRLLGPGFGIVAAVFICLVVAGSLLGNSFVAGRMAVAAANQNWLPRPLAVVGRVGPDREHAQSDPDKESEPDAPINAIILSTALAAIYILLGNFRALLTFNGLGEYTFFFLTVLGAIILRYRQPELARPYKPFVLIPIIFALVSGFVVVRGAAFAPTQALILVGLWALGLVFYFVRRRVQGTRLD